MNRISLMQLSPDELVDRFAAAATRRGEAVLDLNSQQANVFFDRLLAIDGELRSRGREARLKLAPLLRSPGRFA
jgi:hypothetical protein